MKTLSYTQELLKKNSLDPLLDKTIREHAVAEALRKGGSALSPQNKNSRSTLKALSTLDHLAHLENTTQSLWIGLRALNLKAGEHVSGSLIENPIVQVLVEANGCIPTLDKNETIHGLIGTFGPRDEKTLVPEGRIVTFENTILTVKTTETLLLEESIDSFEILMTKIDDLPSRHSTQKTPVQKAGFEQMSYELIPIETENSETLGGDVLFEEYKPRRLKIKNAQEHPSPLVESSALGTVLVPEPRYVPMIPQSLIDSGEISDVQAEMIIYAGQAHQSYLLSDPMDPNAKAPRQGFFIGAGTGVGKGRIISGIILDNWNQGRRKNVWISERHHHINDAKRDWTALGGKESDFIDLRDISSQDDIPVRNGIVFATYSLIRGDEDSKKRLDQIINYVGLGHDGVIALDESHNMRNAVVKESNFGQKKQSKQGEAGLLIQSMLPEARIVYASATSAEDIISLGYAVRLGLWGRGTAFHNHTKFFNDMERGGINALELVARDLKALGLYLAPNLSFDGVQYERLEYKLTPEEENIQDELAKAWADINIVLQSAMASTGITTLGANLGKAKSALHFAQFSMAKARFFQALLSSFKVKPVIESIRNDLKNGYSSIIQVTNTYETNAERAIADCDTDVNDVEATPKSILLDYIEKQFPIQKHKIQKIGKKTYIDPMFDAAGNPILCPVAVAKRDALIDKIQKLFIPEGHLEQIFSAFGSDMIAEVSGRKRRLVPGPMPGTRIIEDRGSNSSTEDMAAFQNGLKNILVFSTSGAAGSSYHADKKCNNKSLRRHYLLQVGNRADQAIQGLGRSHRSNQVQPPVYVLPTTNLWADRRSISSIAAGIQKLGALTRGQRHAASQELFTEEDNLENVLATEAWYRFLKDLENNAIPNMSLAQFEHDTGILVRKFGTNRLNNDIPEIRRFLNAMSGMRCDLQETFGTAYKNKLDEVKLEAIKNGVYDRGIETLTPESLIKLEDTIIYREPRTEAATRLLKMLRIDPSTPISYRDAMRHAIRSGNSRFVKSALTNRIGCLLFPKITQPPADDDKVTVITPNGIKVKTRKDVLKERWILVNAQECEDLWEAELAQPQQDEETMFYVVTGTLLPIWDKLPKGKTLVYRMQTDLGERILGRVISEEWVKTFTQRVDAMNGNSIDSNQCYDMLLKGGVVTLANGWTIESRVNYYTQESIFELVMDEDATPYHEILIKEGLVLMPEKKRLKTTYFFPSDLKDRKSTWDAFVEYRPVIAISAL